jgi:hypothetical protein
MPATYFPSEAQFQAWLGPVVKDAAEQVGSVADVYQLADVRQPDNSVVKEANNLPAQDVAIRLVQITNEQAQETFGENAVVQYEGHMSRVIVVGVDDVFEITSGDFAGQNLQVTKVLNRPLSDSYLLGLVDYEGEL